MLVLGNRLEAYSFERFMQILARHNCSGGDIENIITKKIEGSAEYERRVKAIPL